MTDPIVIYTVAEAARVLGVSTTTIRDAINAGKLKATNIGVKTKAYHRIKAADLDSWAATLPTSTRGGNK